MHIIPINAVQVRAIKEELPNVKVTPFKEDGILKGWDFHCEDGTILRAAPEDHKETELPMSMRICRD